MIKYIVISAARFAGFTNPTGWSESDWSDITYGGTTYKVCAYIDGLDDASEAYADFNFDSEDRYSAWLARDGHFMVCHQNGNVTQIDTYFTGMYSNSMFVVDTLANAKTMLTAIKVNCSAIDYYQAN